MLCKKIIEQIVIASVVGAVAFGSAGCAMGDHAGAGFRLYAAEAPTGMRADINRRANGKPDKGATYVGMSIPIGESREDAPKAYRRDDPYDRIKPGMTYNAFLASFGPDMIIISKSDTTPTGKPATEVHVAKVSEPVSVEQGSGLEIRPGMSYDELLASMGLYNRVAKL